MPIVLSFLKETNIPLWYCDVVSLPDPTAEKGVILGRGKKIDASVAKIPLVGRRCPGKRAPIAYGTLPMQKKVLRNHREREISRTSASR